MKALLSAAAVPAGAAARSTMSEVTTAPEQAGAKETEAKRLPDETQVVVMLGAPSQRRCT